MNARVAAATAVTVVACATAAAGLAQESKTVIGPTNPDLAAGALALKAGDAEEGVRLTQRGLRIATSRADRVTGLSNLCAGYVMLGKPEDAVPHCDRALAANDKHWRAYNNRALAYIYLDRLEEAASDLEKAEAIAPNARTLKVVQSILRDKTDPVAPSIVIDDRRDAGETNE